MKDVFPQITQRRRCCQKPTRILLVGYLGGVNVGDEAIGAAVATTLAEQSNVELCLVSGQPSLSRSFIGLNCEIIKGIYPGPRMIFREYLRLASLVINSDVVLFVGGGLIQDVHSTSLLTHCVFSALLGRVFNTYNVAIGIGAGPVKTEKGRKLTNTFLKNIDFISVRDEPSYEFLNEKFREFSSNLCLGSDSIFLMKNKFVSNEKKKTSKIGLCFRQWPGLSYEVLKILTGELIVRGKIPVFLAYEMSDIDLFKRLDMDFPGKVRLADSSTLDAVRTELMDLDGLISMRLHACLFAIMSRLPFVAICYDPKIENVISGAGFSHQVLPLPLNPDLSLSRLTSFNFSESSERILEEAYISGYQVLGGLNNDWKSHKKPFVDRLLAVNQSLTIFTREFLMPQVEKWVVDRFGGMTHLIPKRLKNSFKKLLGIEW